MKKSILSALLLTAAFQSQAAQPRIAALTPDVTDIIVALDSTKQLVGRDQTSENPAVKNIPSLGLHRQLSVETVMSVRPTLAIGSWMAQPPAIYDNLNKIGIKAVNVAPKDDIKSYPASIRHIGRLIGKTSAAEALASKWEKDISRQKPNGKRYIISYDGTIVAGRGTAADELIRHAGGINAAAEIQGVKPLNREAWIMAKPDVIIIAKHNSALIGGVDKFAKRPEIAGSQAAKKRNIHLWPANDLFRYGLDTPEIVQKLNRLGK